MSQPSSSTYAPSITTQKHSPGNNGMVTNGVADFFSPEIFQIVLHNPTTSHQLLKFSQSRFCGENMEFLDKVRLSCIMAHNAEDTANMIRLWTG